MPSVQGGVQGSLLVSHGTPAAIRILNTSNPRATEERKKEVRKEAASMAVVLVVCRVPLSIQKSKMAT